MPEERFHQALARIEAAARRLESAIAHPPAHDADRGLAERHERLRAGTAEALSRLDMLIATQEART